jgi:hypothetical protein
VAEENRHARDLGRFLDAAGIPRLRRHASDRVFRRLRHVAGLELSLAVLLTAELIAQVYYAAVRRATGSALLRQICKQLLKDESAHVRFQCEQLARIRAARPRWKEAAARFLQRILFAGTCVVVWLSHGRAMRAGGLSYGRFWKTAWNRMHVALGRMDSHRAHRRPRFVPSPEASEKAGCRPQEPSASLGNAPQIIGSSS